MTVAAPRPATARRRSVLREIAQRRRADLATELAGRTLRELSLAAARAPEPRPVALRFARPGTHVIASHDLEMILDVCPRVLVLDRGRVRADGPAAELLSDRELMERHGLEVPYRLRKG